MKHPQLYWCCTNTKGIVHGTTKSICFYCALTFQLLEEDMRNLLFGDYMTPDLEDDERLYAEVPSIERFSQVVESCLDEYNQMHKNRMNLVIFR